MPSSVDLSMLAQITYWADSIANSGVVYCHGLVKFLVLSRKSIKGMYSVKLLSVTDFVNSLPNLADMGQSRLFRVKASKIEKASTS